MTSITLGKKTEDRVYDPPSSLPVINQSHKGCCSKTILLVHNRPGRTVWQPFYSWLSYSAGLPNMLCCLDYLSPRFRYDVYARDSGHPMSPSKLNPINFIGLPLQLTISRGRRMIYERSQIIEYSISNIHSRFHTIIRLRPLYDLDTASKTSRSVNSRFQCLSSGS